MARKRTDPGKSSDVAGMDLTPMIDCTFQLLLFFMICTEMSDSSKTKMQLPVASKAEEDKEATPGRVVVNVDRFNKIFVMGREFSDGELNRVLALESKISREGSPDGFPTRAILIRADAAAEFGAVQRVMALCMLNKLWRIAFGTKDPLQAEMHMRTRDGQH